MCTELLCAGLLWMCHRCVMVHYLFTLSLTYLLTPYSTVLLEKLTGSAGCQQIPRIFGTRRFLTVLTSARHLSLSWANSIQSPQPPLSSRRSILILSSHLSLGLHNGLFPLGFPTRTLCTPLPSPIRATCPAHLIPLDFTTRTVNKNIERYSAHISRYRSSGRAVQNTNCMTILTVSALSTEL